MEGLKRNQRYFIRGEGEAKEDESQSLDAYRDGFMSGKESKNYIVEKTEGEKELISWIMEEVGKTAEEFGLKPFQFRPEHFHIITDEAMDAIRKDIYRDTRMYASVTGITSGEKEMRGENPLLTAMMIAHECYHLAGMNKILFERDDQSAHLSYRYRSGIGILHGPKDETKKKQSIRDWRFDGLNEAITQDLTNFFYARVIRKSVRFRDAIEEFDQKSSTDATNWQFPEGGRVYQWLVDLFYDLCKKIGELQPQNYEHVNDVKRDFFRVYFNGEVKDLKSLLDIVGPGSFGDLSDIGCSFTLKNIERIIGFRKKYGLQPDIHLEKALEKMKEENK